MEQDGLEYCGLRQEAVLLFLPLSAVSICHPGEYSRLRRCRGRVLCWMDSGGIRSLYTSQGVCYRGATGLLGPVPAVPVQGSQSLRYSDAERRR